MTEDDKIKEIMVKFITNLQEEWDAWGEDTKVFKLLDRYLVELYKEIDLVTVIKLKGDKND